VANIQQEIANGSVAHLIFASGILILCCFAALDFFIRMRMKRTGHKWVFLSGGTLNYNDYLRMAKKYGWSAWPVYLMWASFVLGIVLVFVAVSKYGFRP
jgi:hypothetical protein